MAYLLDWMEVSWSKSKVRAHTGGKQHTSLLLRPNSMVETGGKTYQIDSGKVEDESCLATFSQKRRFLAYSDGLEI